jgi:hypothetical protein
MVELQTRLLPASWIESNYYQTVPAWSAAVYESRATGTDTNAADANAAGTPVSISMAAVVADLGTESATCKSENPRFDDRAIPIQNGGLSASRTAQSAECGAAIPAPFAATKPTGAAGESRTSAATAAHEDFVGSSRTKTGQEPPVRTAAPASSASSPDGSVMGAAAAALSTPSEVPSPVRGVGGVEEIARATATASAPEGATLAPASTSSSRAPCFDEDLAYPGRHCESLLRARISEHKCLFGLPSSAQLQGGQRKRALKVARPQVRAACPDVGLRLREGRAACPQVRSARPQTGLHLGEGSAACPQIGLTDIHIGHTLRQAAGEWLCPG